jgi:hypothetical protein
MNPILEDLIEKKRAEMFNLAKKLGVDNKEVIRISQELDVLINKHQVERTNKKINILTLCI